MKNKTIKMDILINATTGLKKLFSGKPFEDIDLVMAFVDFKDDFNKQAKKFEEAIKAIQYKYNELLEKNGTLTMENRKEQDKDIEELNNKDVTLDIPEVPFDILKKRLAENAKKKEMGDNDITMGDMTCFLEIGLTKKP